MVKKNKRTFSKNFSFYSYLFNFNFNIKYSSNIKQYCLTRNIDIAINNSRFRISQLLVADVQGTFTLTICNVSGRLLFVAQTIAVCPKLILSFDDNMTLSNDFIPFAAIKLMNWLRIRYVLIVILNRIFFQKSSFLKASCFSNAKKLRFENVHFLNRPF